MQPDSSSLQQLREIPLAAMEALLESDDLKVISENTALAAVSYWLEQDSRREDLTADQIQGLANKLRLCRCTRWYLTGHLMDREGWLYGALTHQQRTMILASVTDPGIWGGFMMDDKAGCKELVFQGHAEALDNVRWWNKARSKSKPIPLLFKRTLEEIWRAGDTGICLKETFSNGLVFRLDASIENFDEGRDTDEETSASNADTSKKLYIAFVHQHQYAPVVFTAGVSLVSLTAEETINNGMHKVHACNRAGRWLYTLVDDAPFTTLAGAATALQPYIHPGGKLHIKVKISVQ
jgi:hypothetical protein